MTNATAKINKTYLNKVIQGNENRNWKTLLNFIICQIRGKKLLFTIHVVYLYIMMCMNGKKTGRAREREREMMTECADTFFS